MIQYLNYIQPGINQLPDINKTVFLLSSIIQFDFIINYSRLSNEKKKPVKIVLRNGTG